MIEANRLTIGRIRQYLKRGCVPADLCAPPLGIGTLLPAYKCRECGTWRDTEAEVIRHRLWAHQIVLEKGES